MTHKHQNSTAAPHISDLGLLSNRRSAALVTSLGEVVWYCPGRFDAPSLLARLVDAERGGSWAVKLPGAVPGGRQYLGDGGHLKSVLRVGEGGETLTITDFMPFGDDLPCGICRVFSRSPQPYQLVLNAAPDYARRAVTLQEDGEAVKIDGQHWLYASHPSEIAGESVVIDVPAGEAAWAFLSNGRLERPDWETVTRWREESLLNWQELTTHATYHGPYEDAVRASLRALRLLTDHAESATVAAPTTSLPEIIGGQKNWDYRYVWLRDAGMVVSALTRAGGDGKEGRAFLEFICAQAKPQNGLPAPPFMTVDGGEPPEEEQLDLAGYQDSWPVQIGNGARGQLQLDAYGNVLLAAKLIYGRFDVRDGDGKREHWDVVERLAEFLCDHWQDDDYGIWEERSKRPYVAGKVLAAVALEYIAECSEDAAQATRWKAAAADARVWVAANALNAEGAYAYAAGEEGVDVTAALYPVWGFCAPDSPEMLATLTVLERESCQNNLYWRHLADDDASEEGAFLAGTLWVAQYWVMRDPARARTILDAVLAYANDLGLLPEMADPHTRQPLGNVPQTFVHAALIGLVVDLAEAEKKAAE
ncbi:glycoside hydrolase family 15 protein [Deinococcus arenicola]|uniref:Glycoside hydrolase family 15 protein n=1 Tax=Deinococcus arenicola TaxID=2994950 RepID=A0ABU4DRC1_9DEIO|nr:glycoside hydrolase family 15 protein [Deinococcus sp. ZS9-10]MDV6374988.1 glycoside hydrolase family 15 protein [Deinococcus sp. ZS9-10]